MNLTKSQCRKETSLSMFTKRKICLENIWPRCEQCVDFTNDLKETAGAGEEVEEDDEWEILKELYENI